MTIFMWLLYTSKYAWERLERETFENTRSQSQKLLEYARSRQFWVFAAACPQFYSHAMTWQETMAEKKQLRVITNKLSFGFAWTWAIALDTSKKSPFPLGEGDDWPSCFGGSHMDMAQDSQLWVHGDTMFGPQPVPWSAIQFGYLLLVILFTSLAIRPLDINLYSCIFYLQTSFLCISSVYPLFVIDHSELTVT